MRRENKISIADHQMRKNRDTRPRKMKVNRTLSKSQRKNASKMSSQLKTRSRKCNKKKKRASKNLKALQRRIGKRERSQRINQLRVKKIGKI